MLRVSDLVSGLVVAAMGLAIFLRAQSFPSVGGVAIALTSVDSSDPTTPTPGNIPLSSAFTPVGLKKMSMS